MPKKDLNQIAAKIAALTTGTEIKEEVVRLNKLAESLQRAFPEEIEVSLLEGGKELKLRIGAKTAWVDAKGQLSGEASRIGGRGLKVRIDHIG